MKDIIIKIGIIVAVALFIAASEARIKGLKSENSRLKGNQELLLSEKESIIAQSQFYKVSDSLNAVKVSELSLSLSEYKKYRKQDLKQIEQLKVNKSDLQAVIASQSETINNLSVKLKDSIRADTIAINNDTLKCFKYKSKWTDVTGCFNLSRDTAELRIVNRESIKVVETIKYKRFLGFLWKTNKIKSRQVDIVSENPNTSIINSEYINIAR
jgi:hypothetical protein